MSATDSTVIDSTIENVSVDVSMDISTIEMNNQPSPSTPSSSSLQEQQETVKPVKSAANLETDNDDLDSEDEPQDSVRAREEAEAALELERLAQAGGFNFDEENDFDFEAVNNILDLPEADFPKFTLAKNKARFLRMVSWYRQKEEWIEVAPISGVTKLFKQQSKELEGIRSSKMDYEMELETGTLTPSQRSYRRDELKMCKVQEKMAVHLISKLQVKIKSGRR